MNHMDRKNRRGRIRIIEDKLILDILAHTHEKTMPHGEQGRAVEELYWFFRDVDRHRDDYPITQADLECTKRQVEKTIRLFGKDVKVVLHYLQFPSPEIFMKSEAIGNIYKGYDAINNTFHVMSVRVGEKTLYLSVLRNICTTVEEMALIVKQPLSYDGRQIFFWASSIMMSDNYIEAALGSVVFNSYCDIRDGKCAELFDKLNEEFHKGVRYSNGEAYIDNEVFSLSDLCKESEIFEALLDIKDSIAVLKKHKNDGKLKKCLKDCPVKYDIEDLINLGEMAKERIIDNLGLLVSNFIKSSNLTFEDREMPLPKNTIESWLRKNDMEGWLIEMEEDDDGLYET